jgi:hypothetical protein
MILLSKRLASVLALASAAALGACSDDDDPTGPSACSGAACAATLDADITANRTLRADTVYTLASWVHVREGATLTIEPGTRILGRSGSALFVLPGGRIVADGTADRPIVFTSEKAAGSRKPGDWGGLIVVGRGIINRTGTVELEGAGTNTANHVVTYNGGTNNADDSGVLRYVRVEFAGFGAQPNQELNSFTFAAVGSGTQVDYVQALAGLDDSFEWFGGAVDAKHLVSYEAGDDHFDSSEGHVGRNQYLIGYQSTILEPEATSGVKSGDPQGFEVDGCGSASGSGCTDGYNSTPLNQPLFANFTMVGTGPIPSVTSTSGGVGMLLRRGTGGYFVNGIVARWPRAAISLRDAETQSRFANGEAVLRNVFVAEIGATAGAVGPTFEAGTGRFSLDAAANGITAAAGTVTAASLFTALPAVDVAPALAQLDWSLAAGVAPRTAGSGAFTGALATKGGAFVTGTSFAGAADPSGVKWWQGWTAYARN